MRGRQINPAFFNNEKAENAISFKTKFKNARIEGNLNLSSCNPSLDVIPQEVFELDKHIEQDEKFWEIVPLNSLDLSFNKITVLPMSVGNLVDCTSFKMRSNLLATIPEAFFSCSNLRHVDFDNNKVSEIGESVSMLVNVRELIISNNKLQAVPSALFQIASLRHLELQNNQISSLHSSEQWFMPALVHLNVANNHIARLPECISRVRTLEVLFCQGNALMALPNLSQLTSLKFLDASQNQLTAFPTLPIAKGSRPKSQLVQLFVGYNRIDRLDVDGLLAHAGSLCELLVHNNQLTELSPELERMAQLKILDVSNNDIRDLPAGLGYITQLQRLKVDGNPIKTIRQLLLTKPTNELKTYLRTRGPSLLGPASGQGGGEADCSLESQVQFRMRDVTAGVLDLSNLGLVAFAAQWVAELERLPSFATLHTVNLSGNRLSAVPLELVQLPMVKVLLLAGNEVAAASPSSSEGGTALRSVTSLDVSQNRLSVRLLDDILSRANAHVLVDLVANRNQLDYLSPRICQLSGLRSLRVSGCGMMSLCDVDFAALPRLEVLDVSNNKLDALGDSLLACDHLEYLNVENNCLAEIPCTLAQLPQLKVLLITGNPQRTIRSHIVQQGSAKVLEQLRNKLQGTEQCFTTGVGSGTVFGGHRQASTGGAPQHQDHSQHSAGSYRATTPKQVSSFATREWDDSPAESHAALHSAPLPSRARPSVQQRSQVLKNTNMKRSGATNPSDYF